MSMCRPSGVERVDARGADGGAVSCAAAALAGGSVLALTASGGAAAVLAGACERAVIRLVLGAICMGAAMREAKDSSIAGSALKSL